MAKEKFPLAAAETVANEVMISKYHLGDLCERWSIAGSIRRKKADVSDIEIVYAGRVERREIPDQLLPHSQLVNLMDEEINKLVGSGILDFRLNKNGRPIGFGPQNKFLVHAATGIPLDLFSCSLENWWNVLTCRTGSKASNERVSNAALGRGYHWRTGGPGFEDMSDDVIIPVYSEEEVFAFVGLPYLPPDKRI